MREIPRFALTLYLPWLEGLGFGIGPRATPPRAKRRRILLGDAIVPKVETPPNSVIRYSPALTSCIGGYIYIHTYNMELALLATPNPKP